MLFTLAPYKINRNGFWLDVGLPQALSHRSHKKYFACFSHRLIEAWIGHTSEGNTNGLIRFFFLLIEAMQTIAKMIVSLIASTLLWAFAHARVGDYSYPIVERELQMKEISLDELDSVMLTFSFNSPPKDLKQFWLDVYDTDGWLPENSTETIEKALGTFLILEMNARYDYDSVKKLDVQVVSQSTITSSRRKWRRDLQQQSFGSELQTKVSVTFRNEPSPDKSNVEKTVSDVMQDLTMFIANLTEFGKGDNELAAITRAERKDDGFDENAFDDDFVAPIVSVEDPQEAPTERVSFALLMSVVAGGCLILASIALFSIRSRQRPKHIEQDPASSGLGQINVFLGDEDESDIFSIEAALVESPAVSAVSRLSENPSHSHSEASDLFSGIDSQLTSPRESRSIFSFLSGQKSEGSSTVVASNRAKDKESFHIMASKSPRKSPKPKLASLLTFSEEEEEDLESEDSDDMPLAPGTILKPPKTTPEKDDLLVQNDSTTPSETTKVVGVARVKFASSADTRNSAQNSRSPKHTTNNESSEPDLNNSMSMSSTATPPPESFNVRWEDASFPSSKAPQTPKPDPESVTCFSELSPGEKSDGASASTSSYEMNLAWNNRDEADSNAEKAAKFVRGSNPATPPKTTMKAEKAKPLKSFKSPKSPKSPSKSPMSSPGFSSGGRKRGQQGRRHAKSTSADGSRNYQHETMQQKDESLASFDAVSLSDSSSGSPKHHVPKTPQSAPTTPGTPGDKSFFSLSSSGSESTDGSASKQLLSDLVWLEKKIAGASNKSESEGDTPSHRKLEQVDSLSFASNDVGEDTSLASTSPDKKRHLDKEIPKGVSSIVCRDCFAPPGKLRIVIHSTKDGPAIHTVKSGSSLTGHVYPGDLIISVDDVDTRSFTAEQVMKMMTARNKYQRKITVLHFEAEAK